MPVQVDAHGIDAAYSCTQKGLSCPPGLAPFTASPRAPDRLNMRSSPVCEWYLDLKLLAEYYDGRRYHRTASSSLFYALCEGLRLIEEEGLHARFERHVRNHRELVFGLEELGLQMHVAEGYRIPNLNTPRVPHGVDEAKARQYC